MWKVLPLFLSFLVLSSCNFSNNEDFKIPNNLLIDDIHLLSPFFIEQLTEDPIKEMPAWNDSLISLLQINQIDIIAEGLDDEDSHLEQLKFSFRRNGFMYSFNHQNNTNIPPTKTEITYQADGDIKRGTIKKYFNERIKKDFVMLNTDMGIDHVRVRSSNISDTFRLIGTVAKPKVLIRKSGNYVLSVNFIVHENDPLNGITGLCNRFNIPFSSIANSELSVTYVNDKYLPIYMYHLNDKGVQTDLLANWEYSQKRLLSYSRYVKNNLVKDYHFYYNKKSKLLDSFTFNNVPFSITYR